MRKLLMIGAVLAAVAIPTASRAQFTLGLRLGYGAAGGDAAKDFALSDAVKSQVPFQLDGAFRITPEIAVGAYFSYGVGQAGGLPMGTSGNLCDMSGVDCSAGVTRLGLQGFYTFTMVPGRFVPWAGLGTGYEWATITAEDASGKMELSYNGWEYFNLQVGGDFKVSSLFAFGPYVQYAMGQYSDGKVKFAGETLASGIDNKATHSWFNVGIRGKFDFGVK